MAISNTAYDDQGKPPCDEDTRVEILADIKKWVDDVSAESQNFFWLTGDPGCGKSAITASFARYCKDSGSLWAQFFINRNNEATTNPRVYFPSIARQMADHHTSEQTITKTIYEIIKRRPSILDQMTLDQALGLFVETVQAACDLDPRKPVTIVIDGLDETRRDKLQDTAKIFSKLFEVLERRNAKVFISCRTDDEITKSFYRALRSDECRVKHVHLNAFDPSSIEDVSRYLFRNITQIVKEWNLNLDQWPGEERLKTLCVRANGLFIWAVTVVKFFQEQLRQSAHERLNELLDVINEEGMGDVNKLYGKILEITYSVETNTKVQNDLEHEKFRWIVGFIIGMKEPLPVGDIAALLDLRRPTNNAVDVVHFVTNLRTVLIAGTGTISNETIPRLHKSFVEFITSERADPQFRIDAPVVDGQIATKCLRLVNRLKCAKERGLLPNGSVRYAIDNWTRHLPTEGLSKSGVGIVGGDVVGLWKVLSAAAPLSKGSMSASGDYRTHMYDPVTGFPPPLFHHSSTIQGSNAIWAVAVSPDGRLIASGNSGGVVQVWDGLSHEPIWKSVKHGDRVRSVCFSPDSSWLVSGGDDKSARMWDCRTGKMMGSPLLGQTINSVCTDGQRIVSGCDNGTICIWSCATCELIGVPINAGKCVHTVALSNGGRIAAGVGSNVCIFDIEPRREIASMKGHTGHVLAVAFSPNGSQIASGAEDNTIRVWDVQTRKQRYRLDGHTSIVRTVTFSPDAYWIVSGSDDNTVRVWNPKTGQPADPPLIRHTSYIQGVAFSPNGLQLISGSLDNTIQIWALRKWQKTSQQVTAIHLSQHPDLSSDNRISLEGHPSVISASYFPNGSFYAASTLDGRVSIWNMDRELIWETNTSIHPIHLLRFSETQLILSTPDGSTSSWNLLDGKPTHEEAVSRRPEVNTSDLLQYANTSNDVVSWFPYDISAGLWACVDGCFISFDTENSSATIIDVGDYCDQIWV